VSSEQDHPYTDNSGFADFMESEDALAELLRRSARAQANRRGHDLEFRLPIEFIESIAGANKRVTLSDGGTLDVAIPPGIADGQVLRLRGKGAPGSGKGGFGDALIEVEIKPDRFFTRQGDDVYLELPVTLTEAVLGTRIKVPTPTGAVTMAVPKGSNTGTTLRLRGKGAPRHAGGHGDQFVKLKVMLPKESNLELEAFVSNWESGKTYNPREEVTP
jgi:DnaJ-class molecular chaperone